MVGSFFLYVFRSNLLLNKIVTFSDLFDMSIDRSKLKIIILESFYDCLLDPQIKERAKSFFIDLMELKLRGYLAEYPYGYMPFDTTDFIATHHAVCEERDGRLVPLMAYRSILGLKAETHLLTFPLLKLMKDIGEPKYVEAVSEFMEECRKKNRPLSFDSAWTIDPEIRKDEALTQELRRIMMGIHVLYHKEIDKSAILAGGVVRFKMERLYRYWGYLPLDLNKVELPNVALPFMFNEQVKMFKLTNFSFQAISESEGVRALWEKRTVLATTTQEKKKAA